MTSAPPNMNKPPILVYHSNLKRHGQNSRFCSECPFCYEGLLWVVRDQETFRLQESDHCVSCGQRVKYADIGSLRKLAGEE